MKQTVTNWNNYPIVEAEKFSFDYDTEVKGKLGSLSDLAIRGNGRCYGDASLSSTIVSSLRFDKILSFNIEKGVVECQSGLLLSDLLQIIVPKGWFLPV